MSGACSHCGSNLESSSWKFCPNCGKDHSPDMPHQPRKREPAPARFGFIGFYLGLVTAPVLIIYGTLMCLLGPPMVFGIPLIIAGMMAPLLGPYLAINAVRSKCPWCGEKITSVGPVDAFFCYKCSHRVVVKDRELVKAA